MVAVAIAVLALHYPPPRQFAKHHSSCFLLYRASHLEHNFVTLYKSAERFAGGRSWQIQGRGDGRLRRWF